METANNVHTNKRKMAGTPGTLAAALAAAIEADPIVASLIKEHCPPDKLIRLLGLKSHIGTMLAEEATGAPLVTTPAQPGELLLDVSTHDKPNPPLAIPPCRCGYAHEGHLSGCPAIGHDNADV